MGRLLSPGIDVREFDQSPYAPSFPSSAFAVVGSASKGPMDTPTLITDTGTLNDIFGNARSDSISGEIFYGLYASDQYLKAGRALWFCRVGTEVASADLAAASGFMFDGDGLTNAITLTAPSNGTWGNATTVTVSAGLAAGTYKIDVKSGTYPVETYDQIVVGTANESDVNYIETRINGFSAYIAVVDLEVGTTLSATTATMSGGTNGCALSVTDIIGAYNTPPTIPSTGLQTFTNVEEVLIDMVAVPGWSGASVVTALITLAEARGDCVALIDPPAGLNPITVVDWHNGTSGIVGAPTAALDSSYAACYAFWCDGQDAFLEATVRVPPSGMAAFVYAKTVRDGNVWDAPAGLKRGVLTGVISVEHSPTQGERDYMYSGGDAINPIAKPFNNSAYVIWGQRTLQRASTSLDRVHVRRLLIYLERIIARTCRSLIFEPNDAKTWNQLKRVIRPTLDDLAESALTQYLIVCDSTTNTAATIARNELHAKVFVQPTNVAEMIEIDVIALASGVSFNEVL